MNFILNGLLAAGFIIFIIFVAALCTYFDSKEKTSDSELKKPTLGKDLI